MATAFADAFTLHNYRRALARSEAEANRTIASVTKRLPLTGAESQTRIEAFARGNTWMVETATSVWQAVLLIVATMVWGFGDLAAAFL